LITSQTRYSFPLIYYEPLLRYHFQFEDRAFQVVVDKYVTDADGTGIVHQAPAFGEDDHRIALAHGILKPDDMPPCPLDDVGRFTAEVSDFAGQYVKVALFFWISKSEKLLTLCRMRTRIFRNCSRQKVA
jgi:isoleucyl-tRNA synthetase